MIQVDQCDTYIKNTLYSFVATLQLNTFRNF